MAGKCKCWFVVPMFLSLYWSANPCQSDEVILLDDTSAPTPTATFTPSPAQKTVPTPAPTAVPPPIPTLVPAQAQKPAGVSPRPTPLATETPMSENDDSESAKLARRLGVLRKPVIWLALDGNYAYAPWNSVPSVSGGFGLEGRVELQFFSWFSAGAYYNLTLFPASQGILWTGPLGLMGRILPFGPGKTGELEPYLMGGGGLNSLAGQNGAQSPWNFQTFAGIGALYPFGDKWAADFGLAYNFYGPQSTDLETVSVRVGLAYSLQE